MTCHSLAAMAIVDPTAKEAKRNARTDQRFTGRDMPARMVSKIAFTSSGDALSPAIFKFQRTIRVVVRRVVKVSIDLIIFRAKHRKSFCPFDVPPGV